jgi:SEC-C motif-containing protein
MAKIGRNDPCPCGSGKKYKKCCLAKDEQEALAAYKAASATATAASSEASEGEGGEQAKARGTGAPARAGGGAQGRRLSSQVAAPPPMVRRKAV